MNLVQALKENMGGPYRVTVCNRSNVKKHPLQTGISQKQVTVCRIAVRQSDETIVVQTASEREQERRVSVILSVQQLNNFKEDDLNECTRRENNTY